MPKSRGMPMHMWSQLSGCTEGIVFPSKTDANRAIKQLSNCTYHNGIHHFAVVEEGRGIAMSTTGLECLKLKGIV